MLYRLFKFSALILLVCGLNCVDFNSAEHSNWRLLPGDCGRRVLSPVRRVSDRIIGGSQAQRGEYPWMANIFYSELEHFFNSPKCGGSILNENYILTAGHCCMRQNQPSIVRVGDVNLHSLDECQFTQTCYTERQDVVVQSYTVHPAINISTEYGYAHDDICLIRLQHSLKFNDLVQPICLPRDAVQKMNLTGAIVEFAGWGASLTDISSPSLQKTEMTVISANKCNENLDPRIRHDETKEICGEGKNKFCYGDSGGPLVKVLSHQGVERYFILGIASYSTEDLGSGCLDNTPMVFVNTSRYVDWILNLIKP